MPRGGWRVRSKGVPRSWSASHLAILIHTISNTQSKSFFLLKYFCGTQLASIQSSWHFLRDNATNSVLLPATFYSHLLQSLRNFWFPANFSYTAKDFYTVLMANVSCTPILPRLWNPFISPLFSLAHDWKRMRDNFTSNYKNDLAWLITLL